MFMLIYQIAFITFLKGVCDSSKFKNHCTRHKSLQESCRDVNAVIKEMEVFNINFHM